ncbi:MAG: Zn-dependent hydrolase of the beta-lactamase fold-like protein [Parcubacteria group bacterium GW2011_GWF2_43_11]|nr:MAG: Zn-dependent hydrolase of the beta-lactamase fold-like protein [Parcubacteria group bacterium GW2011_GWF2_43_11]
MHIIWHGQSFFQIQTSLNKGEQTTIAIDPFDESTGLKPPSFQADVLLITHDHHDHNNKKAIKGTPFLIEGPGEYEVKEIAIQGIPSFHDEEEGKKRGSNTIYLIEMEEMKVCHLGDFGQKELTEDQLEQIGDIDVLMVPVGGEFTLDAKGAAHVISQIEPKIVIPMHYAIPKLKIKLDEVDKFLKEVGKKSVVPQPKLLIKKKDLPLETQVVVLTQ